MLPVTPDLHKAKAGLTDSHLINIHLSDTNLEANVTDPPMDHSNVLTLVSLRGDS